MAGPLADTLMATLRPALRPMPESFWQEFRARFDPEELMRLMAPQHADVISPADVDELITFFESPINRRWIELQPRLAQIGIDVGRKWGERIGSEIARDER